MSNNAEISKLTDAQAICIQGIISGKKVTDACRDANISRASWYVWMRDESFKEELERRRNEVIESSMNRLQSVMGEAVEKLYELMRGDNPEIARKASNSIIEYGLKWSENLELEEKLEEVERLVLEKRTYRD